jgi:hypothetical protein
MSAIRITGDGPSTRIEVDGVDLSNHLTGADLFLRAGDVPRLELHALAIDQVTEVAGEVVWVALADGRLGRGQSCLGALRALVAILEAEEPA